MLTADLILIRTPATQPPWLITQKLPRLLELGASFLDSLAFSSEHPARGQAHLLRSLLDAGIKGTPASPPVPIPTPQPVFSPPPQPQQQPQQQQVTPWLPAAQPAPRQFQQRAPPPAQQYVELPPPAGQAGPGMDEALSQALDGFDPLFGSTAFWEWGGGGTGVGEAVDWGTMQTDLGV